MSLTALQLKQRENHITASFLPRLMVRDEAAILSEWRRLVGDPDYVPDDLTGKWAVQLGSYIEPFALDWHERKTGQELTRRGDVVECPERPYLCCTLDAYREVDSTVIDCKLVGQWRRLDDALPYYLPQMVAQRACLGASNAALLVVHGSSEPVEYRVDIPADYEAAVWERVEMFWQCVETLTPPVAIEPLAAPVTADTVHDMTGRNEWASEAATWIENHVAAKAAGKAEKALKAIVPADAARCHGHGIVISRDRAGRLSLKEATT